MNDKESRQLTLIGCGIVMLAALYFLVGGTR